MKRFVERLPDGMRAILVRGEPGFGKTAIWREAALAAETAGVQRVCHSLRRGRAADRAWRAVRPDRAGVREIADELPEPQRRAIAVALGVEDPAAVVPDSLTLRERSSPSCGC